VRTRSHLVRTLVGLGYRSNLCSPPDNTYYTGQSCRLGIGSYAGGRKGVFFFRSTLTYKEGDGQPRDSTWQDGLRSAFTPAVVLFIALPETEDKTDPG